MKKSIPTRPCFFAILKIANLIFQVTTIPTAQCSLLNKKQRTISIKHKFPGH